MRDQQNSENRRAAGGGAFGPRSVRLGIGSPCLISSPGCWGEWRNGRRAGFRCQCPSGRGGSSPPSPTNRDQAGHRLRVTRLDFFRAPKCHLDAVRPRVVSGVAHGSFLRMRLAYSAFVSMALLFSAACSTAVEGSAVKDTRAPSGPTIDISKLDVGPYPTEPSQPLGVTGDPLRGLLVEAQRMANNVVGPWEVDAGLTKWLGFGATVLLNAADLANIGPEPFAAAAGRHGFINGFVSARTAEGQKILLNAVLRFPDPGTAAAAATDFGDIAANTGEGVQRAPIPGHPDAQAASYTQTEGSSGKRWSAVRAFSAHGQYV